jgi:shikimate kinase
MDLHVALLGMTGAGKTTVGRAVAMTLGCALLDSDALIAEEVGLTAGDIAARDGVAALHELEQRITIEMLARPHPAVLCVPASAVDDPATRSRLRTQARCFWLDADIAILARRTSEGAHRRTLDASEMERLYDRRKQHFADLAGPAVDTGATLPDETAHHIVAAVEKTWTR